jgi:uncharacterized protein YdaU (DUF1376 family)
MTKVRHVDFYPDDWIAGTSELTLDERGLYITACALIYSRGEAVTIDHLHRVSGVHGRTFKTILGRLVALGKLTVADGMVAQKRCEKELKTSRKRVEKWLKNLDNPEKSDTYGNRADTPRAPRSPSPDSKNINTSQSSTESVSRARVREAERPEARPSPPPQSAAREAPGEAGLAGLAGLSDFKISDEWVVEATNQREAQGLPALDLGKEARKLERVWASTRMPYDPHKAWLKWALRAWPDGTNVVELKPRQTPEEWEAERQAALLVIHAAIKERRALEAAQEQQARRA